MNITEEPDEGKLHVRICAGDVEQSAFLPRRLAEITYKGQKWNIY